MKNLIFNSFIAGIVLLTVTFSCQAEETIQLEKGAIIGNQEAPKAIYIVPWRQLTPVDIKGLEISILLDEELELIDPETFKRQVELYGLTSAKIEK